MRATDQRKVASTLPRPVPPEPPAPLRSAAVITFAASALLTIAWVFWDQDLRYSLPTPRPDDLQQPALGTTTGLPAPLANLPACRGGQPLLLHFYNPGCPCSRFNRDHVAGLLQRHGERVGFVAVLEHTAAHEGQQSGLDMPHVVDTDGAIARALGVYSTPQAVLLDPTHRLVFRGNYNTSRYCSDPGTEFVRLAIEALLANVPFTPSAAATTSYGCELPDAEAR